MPINTILQYKHSAYYMIVISFRLYRQFRGLVRFHERDKPKPCLQPLTWDWFRLHFNTGFKSISPAVFCTTVLFRRLHHSLLQSMGPLQWRRSVIPASSLRHECDLHEQKLWENEVANVFNDYFTAIADGIGFNDPIPSGYENDAVLKTILAKYDDHPSIIAIKRLCPWVIPLHSLMSRWMRHIIY